MFFFCPPPPVVCQLIPVVCRLYKSGHKSKLFVESVWLVPFTVFIAHCGMTYVVVLPEVSVDIIGTADQSLGLLPSFNFRQVGKLHYFSCFLITKNYLAGHCVCLTFSLVVYTPQIHY